MRTCGEAGRLEVKDFGTAAEMEVIMNNGKVRPSIFLGCLFVIGAVALLIQKMEIVNILLGGMSIGQLLLTVFFVSCLINGIRDRSFGAVLFSVAFLIIVNDRQLHLDAITPFPVLGAAILGTIGLHLLFPKVKKGYVAKVHDKRVQVAGDFFRDGARLSYENSMGESVKYVEGEFEEICLRNSFGALQVFFADARPKEGSARVTLKNSFGVTELYVPSDWKVIVDVKSTLGGYEESGQGNPCGKNILYVSGEVAFGELNVCFI